MPLRTQLNNFAMDTTDYSQPVDLNAPCFQMFEASETAPPPAAEKNHFVPIHGIKVSDIKLAAGTKVLLVKIDVEGGDRKALAGALGFLKKHEVKNMIVEYGRGPFAEVKTMLQKLEAIGFKHRYVIGHDDWLPKSEESNFPSKAVCTNKNSPCRAIEVRTPQLDKFIRMIKNCSICRKPGLITPNILFRRNPLTLNYVPK